MPLKQTGHSHIKKVTQSNQSPTVIITPPMEVGPDLQLAEKVWRGVALSETRLYLMTELSRLSLCLADVEEFCLNLNCKYRFDNNERNAKVEPEWKIIEVIMAKKLRNERKLHERLETEKRRLREEIYGYYGKNSRKS